MEVSWMDIISLFFAAAAFFFSLWQFSAETKRNRKEATIHAFDALEENPAVLFLFKVEKQRIIELVQYKANSNLHENITSQVATEWEAINTALPLIEHFAVGINSEIYDLETLNKMAGNLMITIWNRCSSLIEFKRRGSYNQNNYTEFETMVNSLKKLRRKTDQSILTNLFD